MLLILSPQIVIHLVWVSIDRIKITYPPASQAGFLQKTCTSDYLMIWLLLTLLYIVILFLILIAIAIKSRKICQKHFKDTKKVNMFIFLLFFDIVLALSFWWLLKNLGSSVNLYIAGIPLHLGHFGIILLCQLLLIAPKIVVPFSRMIEHIVVSSRL